MEYDWMDEINAIIEESNELLDEGKRRKVIRKGKVTRKLFCKKGQKAKGGKCVAMKAKERTTRKIKAKKGALKRKAKAGKIKKKRAKAMRKRKSFGLK